MAMNDVGTNHLTAANVETELAVVIGRLKDDPYCGLYHDTVRRYHYRAIENLNELPPNIYMSDDALIRAALRSGWSFN